jgi:hypothetical protein
MEFEDGLVESWCIGTDKKLYGNVFYDRKGRFEDGTFIKTSTIIGDTEDRIEGDIIKTRNSTYTLGRELESFDER